MDDRSTCFSVLPRLLDEKRGRSLANCGVLVVVVLTLGGCIGPTPAKPDQPYQNSLGMKFLPLPRSAVLVSIWETRVQDFKAFVMATGYDAKQRVYSLTSSGWEPLGANWENPGFTQTPKNPVCGISREDATAFCEWLTAKERKAGLLTSAQAYRLPTDSEWSLAAGLIEDPDQTPAEKDAHVSAFSSVRPIPPNQEDNLGSFRYPWGNQWPPPPGAGNYAGTEAEDGDWPVRWNTIEGYRDRFPRTAPVGSFAPNRLGLYDLSGNVAEWCEDNYEPGNPSGILRGGSYLTNVQSFLLTADRAEGPPTSRFTDRGFRCVIATKSTQ